jgi:galactose mutarotase-like enzyme
LITTIQNSEIVATLNHKGAELTSLKDKLKKEYIWHGDPLFWGKHAPVLFPIVGTLKNNSYSYNNVSYTLSRHGFARDLSFEIIKNSENSVTFSLISSEITRKNYPFDFEFQIIYTLIHRQIIIEYKIINKNNTVMPFSIGAHPAFLLPNNFKNYTLDFEFEENLVSYQLENDLLSNNTAEIKLNKKKLSLAYSLFENDALIFKKLKSKKITILENDYPILIIKFDDFKNLGIWTKKNAPFVCIEPWLGYSDTFNTSGDILKKEGIQFLEANQTFYCHFSIEIL